MQIRKRRPNLHKDTHMQNNYTCTARRPTKKDKRDRQTNRHAYGRRHTVKYNYALEYTWCIKQRTRRCRKRYIAAPIHKYRRCLDMHGQSGIHKKCEWRGMDINGRKTGRRADGQTPRAET